MGQSVRSHKAAVMRIRSRCKSCHQLLGIARRKSGTQVNCPTCRCQVLVPAQDEEAAAPAPSPAEGHPVQQVSAKAPPPLAPEQSPALFERDDFDALLRPPPSMAPEGPRNVGALLA